MDPNRRIEVESLDTQAVEALVARGVREGLAPVEGAIRELKAALRAQSGVYDRDSLAALLGISPRTLEKWRRERGMPFRKVGRRPVFLLADVLAWVEANGA